MNEFTVSIYYFLSTIDGKNLPEIFKNDSLKNAISFLIENNLLFSFLEKKYPVHSLLLYDFICGIIENADQKYYFDICKIQNCSPDMSRHRYTEAHLLFLDNPKILSFCEKCREVKKFNDSDVPLQYKLMGILKNKDYQLYIRYLKKELIPKDRSNTIHISEHYGFDTQLMEDENYLFHFLKKNEKCNTPNLVNTPL